MKANALNSPIYRIITGNCFRLQANGNEADVERKAEEVSSALRILRLPSDRMHSDTGRRTRGMTSQIARLMLARP
jgi:hypothetical protein